MGNRIAGKVGRVALIVTALAGSAALGGCSLFGPSKFDVLRAFSTVTDGIAAGYDGTASTSNPGTSVDSGPAGTYVYTSANGTAVFSITTAVNPATGSTEPTGGSVVFSGYSDSSQTYSVNSTLSFTIVVTSGSGTNTAPVTLTVTLSLSGGTISTLDCTLAATGGPSVTTSSGVTIFGYSGTLVADGQSFTVDDLYKRER